MSKKLRRQSSRMKDLISFFEAQQGLEDEAVAAAAAGSDFGLKEMEEKKMISEDGGDALNDQDEADGPLSPGGIQKRIDYLNAYNNKFGGSCTFFVVTRLMCFA